MPVVELFKQDIARGIAVWQEGVAHFWSEDGNETYWTNPSMMPRNEFPTPFNPNE